MNANCQTTAMGIMPHKDVDKALDLSLGLDIPYWPQLPNVSFTEDMYVQASQGLPGVRIDMKGERVEFDSSRFEEELAIYSENMNDPDYFTLSEEYSVVYRRFLDLNLQNHIAIRGQMTGPVSFGFRIVDENQTPIIYNEDVRAILFDFMQKKINTQYRQLKEKNNNAFVWVDEPGLGWVFSGLTGYDDNIAKDDYREFLARVEGIKALHLCASVNLPYLLQLGIEMLSFDAYQIDRMPKVYAEPVANFINDGGIIAWGIVPTESDHLDTESPETITGRLLEYWGIISQETGLKLNDIGRQSLLAPARCCLKNTGKVGAVGENKKITDKVGSSSSVEEMLVEKAYKYLKEVSLLLREKLRLD